MTWRQIVCGLFRGHDFTPLFEDRRIALTCVTCGHETPGWHLGPPPPIIRYKLLRFRRRLSA